MSQGKIIIDVRDVVEYESGHVEGAINLSLNEGVFEEQMMSLDPSVSYLLYCRSGGRSGMAADMLQRAGFASVENLGGYEDAAAALNLPIV
jgi:rhodanese-related sulfurtransferase